MTTSSPQDPAAAVPAGPSYAEYLQLDRLLTAQSPASVPVQHDEMVFIIQHQVAELWMKLLLHELDAVGSALQVDDVARAVTVMQRVRPIQAQLYEQWSVLETLSPVDYLKFRPALGSGSGFQSAQYRELVFLLGHKQPVLLSLFDDQPAVRARLQQRLQQPSLYQTWLQCLARLGYPVPPACLQFNAELPHQEQPALWPVFEAIYADPAGQGAVYRLCEQLVDLENQFQLWRFRHLKTVERVIGWRRGTGGSSGVDFLRQVLEQRFFPELLAIRTRL